MPLPPFLRLDRSPWADRIFRLAWQGIFSGDVGTEFFRNDRMDEAQSEQASVRPYDAGSDWFAIPNADLHVHSGRKVEDTVTLQPGRGDVLDPKLPPFVIELQETRQEDLRAATVMKRRLVSFAGDREHGRWAMCAPLPWG